MVGRYSWLIPHFSGIDLSFSLLWMVLTVSSLYKAFIVLVYVPSFCILYRTFMLKAGLFCHTFVTWTANILYIHLCGFYIYWINYVEPLLYVKEKATLVILYNSSVVNMYSICKNFIEFYEPTFIRDNGTWFSLLLCQYLILVLGWNGFLMELGNYPSLFIILIF